jgi:hypothetical protein
MFYGATLPQGLTKFPDNFGSQVTDMDGMFYEATLTNLTEFPADFGSKAIDMVGIFRGAILPTNLNEFPTDFGSQATNMSFMFRNATLQSDIDWSGTVFLNRISMSVTEMFINTDWGDNHRIKVVDFDTVEKFTTGTGATSENIYY